MQFICISAPITNFNSNPLLNPCAVRTSVPSDQWTAPTKKNKLQKFEKVPRICAQSTTSLLVDNTAKRRRSLQALYNVSHRVAASWRLHQCVIGLNLRSESSQRGVRWIFNVRWHFAEAIACSWPLRRYVTRQRKQLCCQTSCYINFGQFPSRHQSQETLYDSSTRQQLSVLRVLLAVCWQSSGIDWCRLHFSVWTLVALKRYTCSQVWKFIPGISCLATMLQCFGLF